LIAVLLSRLTFHVSPLPFANCHAYCLIMNQLDELLTCRLDSRRKKVEPCTMVIFGASGDLTARKLIPALYCLFRGGQLPDPFRVMGFARRPKADQAWREELLEEAKKFSNSKEKDYSQWPAFAENISYCQGEFGDAAAYGRLGTALAGMKDERLRQNVVFYLATQPSEFAPVVEHLHAAGLLKKRENGPFWRRVVVEKPFGWDLSSAQRLNRELTRFVHEQQIFRIDHYLGKETGNQLIISKLRSAKTSGSEHGAVIMKKRAPCGTWSRTICFRSWP